MLSLVEPVEKLVGKYLFFVGGMQLWLNLLLNFLKDSSHSDLAYRLSSLLVDKSSRPVSGEKNASKFVEKLF